MTRGGFWMFDLLQCNVLWRTMVVVLFGVQDIALLSNAGFGKMNRYLLMCIQLNNRVRRRPEHHMRIPQGNPAHMRAASCLCHVPANAYLVAFPIFAHRARFDVQSLPVELV